MTHENIAQITLELGRGNGPIRGRLLEGSRETPFVGWLALAAALESARSEPGPHERSPRPPSSPKE